MVAAKSSRVNRQYKKKCTHAAIASSLSQIVTSPRLLRPRSYSLQFRILYFFLYWRLTRLDFAATMTLPPDL